jgi:O-antigen/teichoic acid export membrane protein
MSSVKDTMKHASIYSMAAMLGKMVGFLMLPFYAHILHAEGYGVIGLLDMASTLLVSMLAYGVRGANVRLYHDQADPKLKKVVISTGVTLIIGVAAIMAVPLMFFARPISATLLENANYSHLVIITLFTFILEMGGQGASSWLLIQSQSVKFAAINLLRLLVGLSLNIWLILFLDMGLNGYFLSSLFTSIVCNSVLLFIAYRNCGTRFDRTIAHEIRRYIQPLVPSGLLGFASRQVERIMVRFQIGMASVGLLEIGYKFPILIAQFVTTPFMQSWNTRRFELADQPEADRQIGEMFTYYLFLATFVGLVIAMIIKPLLVILTPPDFHLAYRIAQVEVVTLILQGVYYHLSFGLLYAKHTHTVAKLRSVVAVVKIGLSWVFISAMGILGAAWSAAIMGAVTALFGFILARRQYAIRMEWKKILLICGLAFGLFFGFSDWDASGTPVFSLISERWLPAATDAISATPLNNWKEGKLLVLLTERNLPMTEVIIKGFMALLFGLLAPIIHTDSRRKLQKLLKLSK